MTKTIFISWEKHRRSQSLCAKLEVPLFELINNNSRLIRYAVLGFRTICLLLRYRPRNLMVQNPSIALSILAVLFKPALRYKLIVDAHNEGVRPYINTHSYFLAVSKWIINHSDYTIVSNKFLAEDVVAYGGTPIIIPDILPDMKPLNEREENLNGATTFAFVCTYAKDEPFKEVFEAARSFEEEIKVFVTGKVPQNILRENIPTNISLLGFIPEDNYISLLQKVDVVIDLTTMKNCLVCGAYEALQLEKPMILSNDEVNETTFPCAILTDNNSIDIGKSMCKAALSLNDIKKQTIEWKSIFVANEEQRLLEFSKLLA